MALLFVAAVVFYGIYRVFLVGTIFKQDEDDDDSLIWKL